MMETILSYAQNQGGGSTTLELFFEIASIVGMWKMFEKAGQPGWPALIPFYNIYKLCEITMGNPWYWLRLFVFAIPVVGWIAGVYFMYQISKASALSFGKPESWAWGFLFLGPVFYCIVGFGDAEYYGPMGVGDNRTGSAREAKTVNFDVVKNDPEPAYRAQTTVEETREDTVDFTFDQTEE